MDCETDWWGGQIVDAVKKNSSCGTYRYSTWSVGRLQANLISKSRYDEAQILKVNCVLIKDLFFQLFEEKSDKVWKIFFKSKQGKVSGLMRGILPLRLERGLFDGFEELDRIS